MNADWILGTGLGKCRRDGWQARAILIGEAGSLVKVTTVDDLVSALRSAEGAAQAILQGVPFRRVLREAQVEWYLHDTLRWFLGRFLDGEDDDLLGRLNERSKAWWARAKRERVAENVIALLTGQPSLLIFALKALGGGLGALSLGTNRFSSERESLPWLPRMAGRDA